jgi:hypothetical protein
MNTLPWRECFLATVEVLNIETLQWSTAGCLPETCSPQATTCGGDIYVNNYYGDTFSCSVEDLLKSIPMVCSDACGSLWRRLAGIPVEDSSLATLKGRVLAIGGRDDELNPTGAIHCYDVATSSWSVIGKMPTPRSWVLTAVFLHRCELVAVGGWFPPRDNTTTEIGSCCI